MAKQIYKVINCGVDNPNDFIDAFSHQCFSTCSHTKRDILYNEDWSENSLIKLYSPSLLQIRTQFLYQDKTLVRNDLNSFIIDLNSQCTDNEFDKKLLLMFQCIVRLYRVFCNDGGKKDMSEAYDIAHNLENDILIAQVYRYAYFLDKFTFNEKMNLLESAYNTFIANGMEDNAIYCKNNKLVRQFDTENISINEFLSLQEEAVHNVPGLVGMSHIYNNVGVAHLMNGFSDEAIPFFDKGLDYAYRPERCIQKIALLCNRLIAQAYCFNEINDHEFFRIMNLIFDNKELMNMPFITARYAMNIISIALAQSKELGLELIEKYPTKILVQSAFKDNILGTGQLLNQISILDRTYGIHLENEIKKPKNFIETTGIKKNFLTKTGYNPFIFSTWF